MKSSKISSIHLPPLKDKTNERTLSALNNAIETAYVVKDLVPFELPKGLLSTIVAILTRVKDTIKNQNDFVGLAEQCSKIGIIIWRTTSETPESELGLTTRRAIQDLITSVNRIQDIVNQKTQSSLGSQIFNVTMDKEIIAGWEVDLDRLLALFNTELNLAANLKLDNLIAMVEEFQFNSKSNSEAPLPNALPAIPPIFFGRDAIVQETVNYLLKCHHVALIGPGGIGKSCIARAVLNDSAILMKFSHHRYFIRYDDMDASQITYGTFLDRIAKGLGINTSKLNQHSLISKTLSSHETLLVLDNAETFLDAVLDLGRIVNSIDEFGALGNVAIMMTTRTTTLPPNLKCARLHVPVLEEGAACKAFGAVYRSIVESITLVRILSCLDFHPLSINIVAHVAAQNQWTPEELVKAWDSQQANLLHNGVSRIQSLAVSIELSLNSPSLRNLGEIAIHLLQVIAFLPQGVNQTILRDLFPTAPNIQLVAEVLCKHSLAYRNGIFLTTLAPIKLYISTTCPNTSLWDTPIFAEVRKYYTTQLTSQLNKTWIRTEDINIEHFVALSLSKCKPKNIKEACEICMSFMDSLSQCKPRPTALRPVILGLECGNSAQTSLICFDTPVLGRKKKNMLAKGRCIASLGMLADAAGQLTEAQELLLEAMNLFLTYGGVAWEELALYELSLGTIYELLGKFSTAEETYKLALKRAPWVKLVRFRSTEALLNLSLESVRVSRGLSGDIGSMIKALSVLEKVGQATTYGQLRIGQVELFSGRYDRARYYFESVLPTSAQQSVTSDHLGALMGLLEVACRQGKVAESKAYLNRLRDMAQQSQVTDDRIDALSVVVAHTTMEGNLGQAREAINSLISEANSTSIDRTSMKAIYIAARIELFANNHSNASDLFFEVISLCKVLSDIRFQARAERALGEIAYLEKDFTTVKERFMQVRSLCDFMGIAPKFLYHACYSCYWLGDGFKAWELFTESRLPVDSGDWLPT